MVRLPVDATGTLPPAPAVLTQDRGRSILIIEDNNDARESLRMLLESLGHYVLEASDGHHGLALVLDRKPEVVLVDLGLPGLDGYEVARAVRVSPLAQTTLLIAVTGYGQAEDRRRTKEVGFDAHLVKPVSQSLLAALISTP
jgi:two-component system, sensor histidine kinase